MADDAPEFVPPNAPHNPPPHEDSLLQRERNIAGTAGVTLEGLAVRLKRLEDLAYGLPAQADDGQLSDTKPGVNQPLDPPTDNLTPAPDEAFVDPVARS